MNPPPFAQLVQLAHEIPPAAAIVLGSGMGEAANRLSPLAETSFTDVPGLEATSVPGHVGRLILGDWAGRRVLLFQGRLHYYESGNGRTVTGPIHTARFLGARLLLLTNAAGGIRDDLAPGSLMAVSDHINWTRPYPWRTPLRAGPPYSSRLRELLQVAARKIDTQLSEGVYAAVTGPCYETPAEIRALRVCGADAVGMSTAREIEAGFELGLECAAISLVTNRAAGLTASPICHTEVLERAAAAGARLADLIEQFLRELNG
jgi:purine-nucleoside phosphorylase